MLLNYFFMRKIIVFLIMASGLILLIINNANLRKERNRLSDNQRALLGDVDYYRTKDSLSVAGVERLTLSQGEFSRYCRELEKMVSDLNIKVKRLQSAGQTAVETRYEIRTEVRDSVIPGRVDTLRCVDYRDDHLTLSGCMDGNRFMGTVESRDTIIQAVHRVPRQFWFIRYGCKAVRQEIVCRNPHSRIVYSEYIELK